MIVAPGITQAEARIAMIRSTLESLAAPAPRNVAGALAAEGNFAAALAAAPAGSGTAATEATTGGGAPAAPTGTSPSGRAPASVEGLGAWASKLPPAGQRWAGEIDQAARAAGIDPALLAALVRHESNFDPNVRSHAGAIGLAQLMPGTAAGLGVDPTDPVANLQGGARYLREQLDRFGTPELALAAYNAGPNRVAQAGGIPRITETQTYVQRVMTTWEQLR
jgi:soluble lytic murein transglycosylase-like protein